MSKDRNVQLQSSDLVKFEVDTSVLQYSQILKDIIAVTGNKSTIPFANISSSILAKVVECCTYHWQLKGSTDEKSEATA